MIPASFNVFDKISYDFCVKYYGIANTMGIDTKSIQGDASPLSPFKRISSFFFVVWGHDSEALVGKANDPTCQVFCHSYFFPHGNNLCIS